MKFSLLFQHHFDSATNHLCYAFPNIFKFTLFILAVIKMQQSYKYFFHTKLIEKGHMNIQKKESITPEKLAQDLATFAIDRTDLKTIMASIPASNDLNLTTIEYELQLLKIISVGWGISFYMAATDKNKRVISELFWDFIREVSVNISTLTQTTTGQEVNYFEIVKERLNTYVTIMQENPDETKNPSDVMGPAFASACNCKNNAIAILTGTKMFTLTLGSVKEYLNSVKIEAVSN